MVQWDYKGEKGFGHVIEGVDDAGGKPGDAEDQGVVDEGDKGGKFPRCVLSPSRTHIPLLTTALARPSPQVLRSRDHRLHSRPRAAQVAQAEAGRLASEPAADRQVSQELRRIRLDRRARPQGCLSRPVAAVVMAMYHQATVGIERAEAEQPVRRIWAEVSARGKTGYRGGRGYSGRRADLGKEGKDELRSGKRVDVSRP